MGHQGGATKWGVAAGLAHVTTAGQDSVSARSSSSATRAGEEEEVEGDDNNS
jgi:hypothetical protein